MEARKRGMPRETTLTTESDPEAPTSPYASMESDGVMMAPREDSHLRSLAKGLTWRFVASGTTIVIAKVVTGETAIAFQIGFFEFFAKIGIYYVHERIWAKIKL